LSATIAPLEVDALTVLRGFMTNLLPAGVPIVRTVVNRVPEPRAGNWIALTPILRTRLSTNLDDWHDCALIGGIAGTTLTISRMLTGIITSGAVLYGPGVATGTVLGQRNSDGTWQVSPSQTVPTGTKLACGQKTMVAPTEFCVQIDVHGPMSGNTAQMLMTVLRDDYAVSAMDGTGVAPLYATDPRMLAFVNDQSQMEMRWTLEAHLQIDPVVTVPQQYADVLDVTLVEVDVIDLP
jgi:hypothetical protein